MGKPTSVNLCWVYYNFYRNFTIDVFMQPIVNLNVILSPFHFMPCKIGLISQCPLATKHVMRVHVRFKPNICCTIPWVWLFSINCYFTG